MTVQTTAAVSGGQALSNSIRTQYVEDYLEGAMVERLYDQLAAPVGKPMEELKRGSSVQVDFLSEMAIATTAISEVTDINPVALRDATGSVTPTSRANVLQASEKLLIQAYTDYGAKMYKRVGSNLMESLEVVALDAALTGDLVIRPAGITRVLLNKTSTGHRATDSTFSDAATWLQTLRCPGFVGEGVGKSGKAWAAIMHPAVFHDIREDGNVLAIGQYQNQGILLNYELGSIGSFRLVVSPWAKVLWGGGAAEATDPQATTLSAAVSALAKTLTVSTNTHLDNIQWLNIGTAESGSTYYPSNERIRTTAAISGSTVTFVGQASNGGMRFDHASATAVNNSNSVFTIIFGGPASLAKVYATEVGEFGEIVGPRRDGSVDQWVNIGWKWYGGYGLLSQNHILRAEVSASVSDT